eukprot:c28466_g1_i2 orf=938-2011(+)
MSGTSDMVQTVSFSTIAADVKPDHLLVLVNGIFSSQSDWKYVQRELRQHLSSNFIIYASAVNSYLQTLAGIDVAGRRLAEEVWQVVEKIPGLKRISFLAHSLGGLFVRYAIGILFLSDANEVADARKLLPMQNNIETIAGLEPLPFLLGVPFLEKLAAPVAPYVIGRTGQQLFLTDGNAKKPPLLLQMTLDYGGRKFISALGSFQTRICYANVSCDHMVGWRTSSIRRETELPMPPKQSLDGYKHVVSVVDCPPVQTDCPSFKPETIEEKKAGQTEQGSAKAVPYYDRVEEEMIQGLQQVGWKKVDVSFHSAFWPFLAHNNIHVKQEWLHYEGAGVVAHVIDCLKQQEHQSFIVSSL